MEVKREDEVAREDKSKGKENGNSLAQDVQLAVEKKKENNVETNQQKGTEEKNKESTVKASQ